MTFSLATNKGINPITPQRGSLIGRSSGRVPDGTDEAENDSPKPAWEGTPSYGILGRYNVGSVLTEGKIVPGGEWPLSTLD